MAMNCYDLTSPIYQALDIAVGYFVAAGDSAVEANHKSIRHIIDLFNGGERRPLMLANRAIQAVEREEQAAREFRNSSTKPWFREHS
jgi:hypothetical protein